MSEPSNIHLKDKVISLWTGLVRALAQLYLKIKQPTLIAVAGSVGKTGTKIMIGQLLASQKHVSYMDDSYNYGLGLYLSVFECKVPTNLLNPIGWLAILLRIVAAFFRRRPEIMVLEYGIDTIGEMDKLLEFAQPDLSILTAITPEHMEFFSDIETVTTEETKIIEKTKDVVFVNNDDVNTDLNKYNEKVIFYGSGKNNQAYYNIKQLTADGIVADFFIEDQSFANIQTSLVSEHMVRQLCGAIAISLKCGLSAKRLSDEITNIKAAPGRMRVFNGHQGSTIIDDTANFSPAAGVQALKTLKSLPASRRVVVLGNMHELGDYAEKGFGDVSKELKGIDVLVCVGDLSAQYFGEAAVKLGLTPDKSLFFFNTSPEAGIFIRDNVLQPGDLILVKGPFGGFYLEECVKKLLANPDDNKNLTRQSKFWLRKKHAQFGDLVSE